MGLEHLYNDMNQVQMDNSHTLGLKHSEGCTGVGTGSFSGTISPEIKSSSNSSIEKRFSPERKMKKIPCKQGNFTHRESTAKKFSPANNYPPYQNILPSNFLQQTKFHLPLGKINKTGAFKIKLQNTDRGYDYDDSFDMGKLGGEVNKSIDDSTFYHKSPVVMNRIP